MVLDSNTAITDSKLFIRKNFSEVRCSAINSADKLIESDQFGLWLHKKAQK